MYMYMMKLVMIKILIHHLYVWMILYGELVVPPVVNAALMAAIDAISATSSSMYTCASRPMHVDMLDV